MQTYTHALTHTHTHVNVHTHNGRLLVQTIYCSEFLTDMSISAPPSSHLVSIHIVRRIPILTTHSLFFCRHTRHVTIFEFKHTHNRNRTRSRANTNAWQHAVPKKNTRKVKYIHRWAHTTEWASTEKCTPMRVRVYNHKRTRFLSAKHIRYFNRHFSRRHSRLRVRLEQSAH